MHSKLLGSDKVKISSDTTALLSLTFFGKGDGEGTRAHLFVIFDMLSEPSVGWLCNCSEKNLTSA
jgi:hypothetical protein